MATTTRMVPLEWRGLATGIVNAGGSFGQFVMAPIAGALMAGLGWIDAMQVMGLLVLLCLPAVFILRGAPTHANPQGQTRVSTSGAIHTALRDPSFLMLSAGFFVCGFHVAFLATHLPGIVASCGLPLEFGAWSLAMLGLFNIVGSLTAGWAIGRWRMKSLLSLIYATRAVAVLVFLNSPKTGPVVLAFAAVMLTHQVGGFFGAWLGGRVYESTGSYDVMWYVDVALAVAAALIHMPIREARVMRAALA
jgi:predicted MFS family arabinose efflux permease